MKKWDKIRHALVGCLDPKVRMLGNGTTLASIVKDALKENEREFVAAGGDGTVNLLLNELLSSGSSAQLQEIRLGALALGSSNDFHKPVASANIIDGISWKVNFAEAKPRDVGFVTYANAGRSERRYFLSNASVGVTAEANRFFNNPNSVLRILKRVNTPTAILYAALETIFTFRNIRVSLSGLEDSKFTSNLTNFGILKNPHVSGDLCCGSPIALDNGRLTVHLCHDMTRVNLLQLLWAMGHGSFQEVRNKSSWERESMTVTSDDPFAVEFDGEVISTTSAQFGILPQRLQVCP